MMEKISRGPKKIQGHYGMKDYYKYYKDNNDSPVSATKYNKVISLLKQFLMRAYQLLVIRVLFLINRPFTVGLKPTVKMQKRQA